ncbi:MAG: methyltransferase domain-containing protein [Rickettsiales bacterium]|nr:methyltransferase domain-containing protein [Rickettsiales bacterium]
MKKKKNKPGKSPAKKPKATVSVLPAPTPGKKQVLQVVLGKRDEHGGLHSRFHNDSWEEICAEILPSKDLTKNHDVSTLTQLPSGRFDAVWCIHTLEFFFIHHIPALLKIFQRILKPGGYLFATTPDLQKAAEKLYRNGADVTLYGTKIAPISALDIIYGLRPNLQKQPETTLHRCGYSAGMLGRTLKEAGFHDIKVQRDGYRLWAIAHHRPDLAGQEAKLTIQGPDINEIMQKRDNIDQEPNQWKGFPPKDDKPAKK